MTGLSWSEIIALIGVLSLMGGTMLTWGFRCTSRMDTQVTKMKDDFSGRSKDIYDKIEILRADAVQKSHIDERFRALADRYDHTMTALKDTNENIARTNGRLDNLLKLMVDDARQSAHHGN